MAVISIEDVLAAEAEAIHGARWQHSVNLTPQNTLASRARMYRDERDNGLEGDGADERKALYRALNGLNRAALCCSGGGIRSATFCLGVVQALAAHNLTKQSPTAPDQPTIAAPASSQFDPENSLLRRFHYLSTVSGGGYFGSWLSSWLARSDFATVMRNLTGRPAGPDFEPPQISWLRAYSNYLTPRIGITSADTWAAMAIIARNLILNWLIIIPLVCVALLTLKLIAAASVRLAESPVHHLLVASIGAAGLLSLVFALAFTTRHRPTRRKPDGNVYEPAVIAFGLAPSVLSAIAVTIFCTSHLFSTSLLPSVRQIAESYGVTKAFECIGLSNETAFLVVAAGLGLLVYAAGWILGLRFKRGWSDFVCAAVAGLVYGALIALGTYWFHLFDPYHNLNRHLPLLLAVILGVPWVLMSQLAASVIFAGLSSYDNDSDLDREWLGRGSGWLMISAAVWGLTAFLVFAGEYAVLKTVALAGPQIGPYIAASGGITGIISGIVTAWLGSSSKTAAEAVSGQGGTSSLAYSIGLAIAGPLFAAVLIVALSIGLDRWLFVDSLLELLRQPIEPAPRQSTWSIVGWLVVGLVVTASVGSIASIFVNINRFSLHALYRNRLIRGYLGASCRHRHPDHFTGFAETDNIRMHQLWEPDADGRIGSHRLFHVINIALNVVSTRRLAWQERKAMSFTVSPLHCGNAHVGFRRSREYGDRAHNKSQEESGISLGTAMAISGAAVSPNMGYNSSPSISLLLTLFNVRLGWWLGNPGPAGDKTYQSQGPWFSARPLLVEAFGLTDETSPYVYLSDGGHFEDLGLYEMVRRRCRFIVVIDAGCDPKFGFDDLGNAVRKIYIDLGIRITFNKLQALRNRPTEDDGALEDIPYFSIGTIDYKDADGSGCDNGYVLYVKPAYHGTEGAGIRSYAAAHPEFPHETTVDQWFTESQFESYRSLGLDIMNGILEQDIELAPAPQRLTLRQLLARLPYVAHSQPSTP
jgi:hypothetical protein